MIHQYKLNGFNIVLDVCSGAVHVVDEIAYDIIAMFESVDKAAVVAAMAEKHPGVSEADISECYDQVQGLKDAGIRMLLEAKQETGMPIISEIMNIRTLDLFENVDIIQVGARNMQNFELLKELGKTNKPILLKRGLANTVEETLMSAEYIMSQGNDNVILCERGVRTFETYTRNTLDISAIPIFKKLSHLPVVVDPSHSGGISWLVEPLCLAAVAAGADGLIIEVHNDPAHALCDGAQSITPKTFDTLAKKLSAVKSNI